MESNHQRQQGQPKDPSLQGVFNARTRPNVSKPSPEMLRRRRPRSGQMFPQGQAGAPIHLTGLFAMGRRANGAPPGRRMMFELAVAHLRTMFRKDHMKINTRGFLFALLMGSAGCSTHRNAHIAPAADVDMDGKVLARFQHEIEEYIELHRDLVKRIPNVGPNATAEEIAAHRDKMTKGIQAERKGARQGDVFKPSVEAAIRRIIAREISSPEGQQMIQELKQGNPKVESVPNQRDPTSARSERVLVAVNALYNTEAPSSSMPPSLLLKLPQLPDQVRYQFVGRDLILRDTEANVILDFIKDVITDRSVPR